jgi:hypothetical protein
MLLSRIILIATPDQDVVKPIRRIGLEARVAPPMIQSRFVPAERQAARRLVLLPYIAERLEVHVGWPFEHNDLRRPPCVVGVLEGLKGEAVDVWRGGVVAGVVERYWCWSGGWA